MKPNKRNFDITKPMSLSEIYHAASNIEAIENQRKSIRETGPIEMLILSILTLLVGIPLSIACLAESEFGCFFIVVIVTIVLGVLPILLYRRCR